jgi:hypothetical protein
VGDQELTFGISGRLYKSNVLLYDHQTESLWSQLKSQAISGKMVGQRIEPVPSVRMSWKKWKQQHPQTKVLSDKTGYRRNYAIDPYEGYYRIGSLMFPVGKVRIDLPAKERILGVAVGDAAKAYVLEKLQKNPGKTKDRIGETDIDIEVSPEGEIVAVRNAAGGMVPHMFVYWFAWQAFHPNTEVSK